MSSNEINTSAPRKFVAPTSRQALRLVRESLGPDAMVLASRALDDGFEIVAIAEGDNAALLMKAQAPQVTVRESSAPASVPADTVLSELHSMRTMIEEGLAGVAWNDKQRRDPRFGRLLRTMLAAGFSARLSKAMLEHLPPGNSYAEGLSFVRAELTRALPVQEDEDAMLVAGGAYALVGPTGVGKTTTTAKLAARCVMRFGAEKLALVTTDGYRIGAYEQLRIYGQILGVPVYAVKDAGNLQSVLDQLRDKHMVLIDTVGMSQRDRAVSDQIAMLCNTGVPVKRLLLLNAASHGDTLNEAVYAYQHAGNGNQLAGCIFTKLDEAVSHGALLDTVIRHLLPVHYLSNGQKVPENLITASRAQLVEDALRYPAPGALFLPDPYIAPAELAPGAEESGTGGRASQTEERLRLQYQQLIRAMDHDAEEIAAAAKFLQNEDVGFNCARELWTAAANEEVQAEAMNRRLLRLARSNAAKVSQTHVLAVCGQLLVKGEGGEEAVLHSSVLLSDRDGRPFAAPNNWLTPDNDAGRAPRHLGQGQWLARHELGFPVVHLLSKTPADELPQPGQGEFLWLSRESGSTVVVDPLSGSAVPLWRVQMEFGEPQPIKHRGKNALLSYAETPIRVRCGEAGELTLRCVRRRIVDKQTQRPLEQLFLLSNVGAPVEAAKLARWHDWGVHAESFLRLTDKGVTLLGGVENVAAPSAVKRLLIAGQVATTAWRVLQVPGDKGEHTRALLAELAGRPRRNGRRQPSHVVFEGLAKLFLLLDALAFDSSDAATGTTA